MDNSYDPPSAESPNVGTGGGPRWWPIVLFGFGGAFAGYVLLIVLANMEDWQFYTIRSTITGETAMSQIVQHRADRWIFLLLHILFVLGGAFAGIWTARRRIHIPNN